MVFFISNSEIEYLEEDTALVVNQQDILRPSSTVDESNQNSGSLGVDVRSQCSYLDELMEYPDENAPDNRIEQTNNIAKVVCQKCTELNLELQKCKSVVLKLQKRCTEKSAEIKRLRAAEKRAKLAKISLEEILREFKANKWISDEGQEVSKVNK